jgi:hypothetical protein
MTTNKERRKVMRTPSNLPLDICDLKGRMVVGEGRFLNLSTLGGLMESRKPLKPKSPVRLQIVSAGKSALDIAGRVVWAKKKAPGFMYGIRFNSDTAIPAV